MQQSKKTSSYNYFGAATEQLFLEGAKGTTQHLFLPNDPPHRTHELERNPKFHTTPRRNNQQNRDLSLLSELFVDVSTGGIPDSVV
jgi:hypothetical protein